MDVEDWDEIRSELEIGLELLTAAVAVKNFYGAHPVRHGERERVCGAAAAVEGNISKLSAVLPDNKDYAPTPSTLAQSKERKGSNFAA